MELQVINNTHVPQTIDLPFIEANTTELSLECGHEGGSKNPFIVSWPNHIKPNWITHQVGHVVDLVPTFMDILDIEYPKEIAGYPTSDLDGSSLMPIFNGEERIEPDYFMSGLDKHRMFRSEDYKIARVNGDIWELYNIKSDPSEMEILAYEMQDKVFELSEKYESIFE
jgi:arylsulfatase